MKTETGEVEPKYIERDPRRVTDVAPKTWWNNDITKLAGFEKWMKVVADAKSGGALEGLA